MNTKHFFSIILVIAFLGSLTKTLALSEKRSSLDETELTVSIASAVQSDAVKADFDGLPNLHPELCTILKRQFRHLSHGHGYNGSVKGNVIGCGGQEDQGRELP